MDSELWSKILDFPLDEETGEYTFSIRLANENQWTLWFTRNAILEYKKFMYLAACAEAMVSPSEIVDKVWHQHLIYTESYSAFCVVLGKEIKHVPSSHDPQKATKFAEAMVLTQQLYKKHFGELPVQFWKQKSMLDSIGDSQRKKSALSVVLFYFFLLCVCCVPAFFLFRPIFSILPSPQFQFGILGIALVVLVGLEFKNRTEIGRWFSNLDADSFLFHLHPFELIYLKSRNVKHLVHAGVNELIKDGTLEVVDGKSLRAKKEQTPQELIAKQIVFEVNEFEEPNYSGLFPRIRRKPLFQNIAISMDLVKKNLDESAKMRRLLRLNCLFMILVLVPAISRITIGISRDKPVGFMVLLTLVLMVIFAWYLYHVMELPLASLLPKSYKKDEMRRSESGYWDYFLIGSLALMPEFKPLMEQVKRDSGSTTWTDTASCGTGSGCGGACGGCGGCGS